MVIDRPFRRYLKESLRDNICYKCHNGEVGVKLLELVKYLIILIRLGLENRNVFREGVTISRSTGQDQETVVGNRTYWFANSHAGHNARIGDEVILVNGTLVAGHCTIGRGAILPANGTIHQFTWVGEKVMFQGVASAGMHVPPYVMCAQVNNVVAINSVGLRRSEEITAEDRKQIKEAFQITYGSGLKLREALEKMDACTDWGAA
ncbi:hypothetical protein LCGC14_3094240, partial [marine sediment metagenome]